MRSVRSAVTRRLATTVVLSTVASGAEFQELETEESDFAALYLAWPAVGARASRRRSVPPSNRVFRAPGRAPGASRLSYYGPDMDAPAGPIRVKICCIQDVDEARMAVRSGASALGLVSAMPSGPGPISEEAIAEIARTIPPGVSSFLLTSQQDVPSIVAQQHRTGVNTLQLVDELPRGGHEELRRRLPPGIGIVQVIHVSGPESLAEALAVSPFVDALLLDSGNPRLTVKELGGTGRTHDWALSREIRRSATVPVFLAGGLTDSNVGEAIARVGPFGVDVCSGVRTNGRLDAIRLARFIRSASRAVAPGSHD